MGYSREEFDLLWKASVAREDVLVAEYRRTYKVPSRGVIITPEIQAERDEQKRLFGEWTESAKDVQTTFNFRTKQL